MKLVKIQLCKLEQTGVFLGRIPGRLLKTGLRLELTVWESAADEAIQKKIFWSGIATLMISNEVINDIMKIIKSLKESSLLTKGVTKRIKKKRNNRGVDFLALCYPFGESSFSVAMFRTFREHLGNILKEKIF